MPKAAALACSILLLAGALAGCGSSSDEDDKSSPDDYLLTTEEIEDAAAATDAPEPVTAALGFWRDVQFQNYAGAYDRLSPALREQIPYRRFQRTIGKGRGVFLARPEIYDLPPGTADQQTVYVVALQGEVQTDADQVVGFDVVKQGGGDWVIGSDVFNFFREPTPKDSASASEATGA